MNQLPRQTQATEEHVDLPPPPNEDVQQPDDIPDGTDDDVEDEDDDDDDDDESMIEIPSWTLDSKPPPFPFNLSTTAVCALLHILLILGNLEVAHGWFGGADHQVWLYLFYIVPRAVLTTVLAFASTFLYEGFLAYESGWFYNSWRASVHAGQQFVAEAVAFAWDIDIRTDDQETENRWEELSLVADALYRGDNGNWKIARVMFDMLAATWETIVNLVVVFSFVMIRQLARDGVLWALEHSQLWGSLVVVHFIRQEKIWADKPSDSSESSSYWMPLCRMLGQVALQLFAAAALVQLMFYWRFRVHEAKEIYEDPDMMGEVRRYATALRATVVHLVSYTTYQVARFVIPAEVWSVVPGNVLKQELMRGLCMLRSRNKASYHHAELYCLEPSTRWSWLDFRGGACLEDLTWLLAIPILLLVGGWLTRRALRGLARVGWWLCEPVFVWQTAWVAPAVSRTRTVFLQNLDADLGIGETAVTQALTSLLFPGSGPLPVPIYGGYDAEGVW